MTLPPDAYLWFKTLHIVGVVVWFAGLFYLVRLFIYHAESDSMEESLRKPFRDQYSLMEKRLANIITTPGLILTVSMAAGLIYIQPSYLQQGWMQVKLSIVFLLLLYHFFCYRLMGQLEKGISNWKPQQLRALNELPTIFLVLVVMLVVFKNQFPTSAASWLIIILILFMAITIQLYARYRRLKSTKTGSA